jgi:putative nucleotidyltransferase with HDIG domain
VTGPLALAREALAGQPAWVVGGVPRDRALGRDTSDVDLVLAGDVEAAARAVARGARAAVFELSDDFGAWRVVARSGAWQIDLNPVRGGSLEADLALRDFTVNAVAEPLGGGPAVDPLGGLDDLAARRLRIAGPEAFAQDPLRVLRMARLAVELELEPDAPTLASARASAPALGRVAAERVFAELRRIVASDRVAEGFMLLEDVGALAVLLPELEALRGVDQNRFHHRDVHGHTLEVLEAVVSLQRDPAAVLGDEHAAAVAARLAEPLADQLTRGDALRLGALLHDVAKPVTRAVLADGRVSFVGHDVEGARMSREILARLRASERLRAHVAALARHHLRLGFLVHEQPLSRRAAYRYLHACEPVEVDVTLLSVADRLATRGDRAEESIARHLDLARELLGDALRWREQGQPQVLLRGDRLARELDLPAGPVLGELLAELAEAQYAGEVATPEQALEHARRWLAAREG